MGVDWCSTGKNQVLIILLCECLNALHANSCSDKNKQDFLRVDKDEYLETKFLFKSILEIIFA